MSDNDELDLSVNQMAPGTVEPAALGEFPFVLVELDPATGALSVTTGGGTALANVREVAEMLHSLTDTSEWADIVKEASRAE